MSVLAYLVLLVCGAMLVALLYALNTLGRLKEWHHGYLGALLVALSWLFPPPVQYWGWLVGAFILYDDTVQHVTQLREPTYASPLHVLNGLLWEHWSWWRWLNTWLDSLVKKV